MSTPLLTVADLNDTTVDHVTFDTPDHYITIGEFFDKARETIAVIFAEKDYHEIFNTEQQFLVNTIIDFTEHLWEMTKSNFINKSAFISTDDLINDVFECLTEIGTRNVYHELIKPEYLFISTKKPRDLLLEQFIKIAQMNNIHSTKDQIKAEAN